MASASARSTWPGRHGRQAPSHRGGRRGRAARGTDTVEPVACRPARACPEALRFTTDAASPSSRLSRDGPSLVGLLEVFAQGGILGKVGVKPVDLLASDLAEDL